MQNHRAKMMLKSEIKGHPFSSSQLHRILRASQEKGKLNPNPFALRFKIIKSFLKEYSALNEDKQEWITAPHSHSPLRRNTIDGRRVWTLFQTQQQPLDYCVCLCVCLVLMAHFVTYAKGLFDKVTLVLRSLL